MKKLLLIGILLLPLSVVLSQNLQISGGNNFSAAVCDNQQVFVWGANSSGQMGIIDIAGTPEPSTFINIPQSVVHGNIDNTAGGLTYGNLPAIRQIDAGSGGHLLGLSCSQQVWAWGENSDGQLGRNTTGSSPVPQRVLRGAQAQTISTDDPNGIFLNNIVYVSGGNNSSFAIEAGTGKVLAWGANDFGQLGDGSTTDKLTPVYVMKSAGVPLTGIAQIEGGDDCAYALDSNGYVWSWGISHLGAYDNYALGRAFTGQVTAASGLPNLCIPYAGQVLKTTYNGNTLSNGNCNSPVPLDNIVQLSGGDAHALALDANGNVWSWGGEWGHGQLGQGPGDQYKACAGMVVDVGATYSDIQPTATPTPKIPLGDGVDGKAIYIAAGQAVSAIVMENGKVVTFGSRGLFNSGTTTVAVGSDITCPADGDVITAGSLGDNNTTTCNSTGCSGKDDAANSSQVPVYVKKSDGSILTGITQVSDGDAWFYAIDGSGNAYTWGWNRRGELGLGDYVDRCAATPFTLPSGCSFSDPCPTKPNLGLDVETCPVFSQVLNSNVAQLYPSWKYTWEYTDGTSGTWTTLGSLTDDVTYSSADQLGQYRVSLIDNRGTVPFLCAPCPVLIDTITFTEVASPYTVTGCEDASASKAQFEVVSPAGSLIKWYTNLTGGSALNPSDTDPSIVVPFSSTNTSIPGCDHALFAEDISSISGALMPSQPCAAASGGNVNGSFYTMITANQAASITEVSFVQGGGWGAGTWTLSIHDNVFPSSVWCSDCSPNGNYNGPSASSTVIETSTSFPDPGSSAVRTWTLATPYPIAAGTYWLEIKVSGGAIRPFSCSSPALVANNSLWVTPVTEANNVLVAKSAMIGAASSNYGGLFNIGYQAGAAYSCGRILVCASGTCTLPVELLNFEAEKQNSGAQLSWTTSKETNSAYFVILKSTDGSNFTEIGKVNAAGNSSSTLEYSFVDETIATGPTYYKLAQYDIDGKVSHSEIKSVIKEGVTGIKVVPNPNNGSFQVLLQGYGENSAKLVLLNSLSQIVYSSDKATQNNGVNIQHLASGVYYLQVISENGIIVEKIVKE